MYISAEWESKGTHNHMVVWDDIIRDKRDAVIDLQKVKSKYLVYGLDKSGLEGEKLKLTFHYNMIPWVKCFINY